MEPPTPGTKRTGSRFGSMKGSGLLISFNHNSTDFTISSNSTAMGVEGPWVRGSGGEEGWSEGRNPVKESGGRGGGRGEGRGWDKELGMLEAKQCEIFDGNLKGGIKGLSWFANDWMKDVGGWATRLHLLFSSHLLLLLLLHCLYLQGLKTGNPVNQLT